jgi:hypothetical protein
VQLIQVSDERDELHKRNDFHQKQIADLKIQLDNLDEFIRRRKDEIKEKERDIQELQEMLDKQQIEVGETTFIVSVFIYLTFFLLFFVAFVQSRETSRQKCRRNQCHSTRSESIDERD